MLNVVTVAVIERIKWFYWINNIIIINNNSINIIIINNIINNNIINNIINNNIIIIINNNINSIINNSIIINNNIINNNINIIINNIINNNNINNNIINNNIIINNSIISNKNKNETHLKRLIQSTHVIPLTNRNLEHVLTTCQLHKTDTLDERLTFFRLDNLYPR